MLYRTLGKTGLRVSVMGLGCGGKSRIGQRQGKTESESVALIRLALENGVNYFDTAEAYDTESILGKAIGKKERESVILATKVTTKMGLSPAQVEESLERSLRNLRTDYIDVYQLHGVVESRYESLVDTILPVLQRLQKAGKIRYIGITENFNHDRSHELLKRALLDPYWDTIMVGFNIINQNARRVVLPAAMNQNIGVVVMFAVRVALSRPEIFRAIVKEQIEIGTMDPDEVDADDPLGFLVREGIATSVTDAAYRFCRDEAGTHVILSGTGDPEHLEQNVSALNADPLPEEYRDLLKRLFARVENATGQIL